MLAPPGEWQWKKWSIDNRMVQGWWENVWCSLVNKMSCTWQHKRDMFNTAPAGVWRRRYLQEIGYTDTIIDVRSARIRQMLGLPSRDTDAESKLPVSIDQTTGKRMLDSQGNGWELAALLIAGHLVYYYYYYYLLWILSLYVFDVDVVGFLTGKSSGL